MKPADTQHALVPKLQFPEFRGALGWNATVLGKLSEVVRGGSPRPIDGFLTTSADGLNWLKIGDVDKDAKFVTQTAEKVRPEARSKTRVVNPGDLILSNSMSFGRPYILEITTCIHDGWIAITSIIPKAERDFLYYQISAPSSQSYFTDNAAGSGVQNLNADIIKALPICFPSIPEQQKIAECLSSVDELIAAQARKVDALKTHKKGLMQQLFPREGETQPRLRFPEFQNAGEWVLKKLGTVCEIQRGKFSHRPRNDPKFFGGQYPFIQTGDVVKSGGGAVIASQSLNEEGLAVSKLFKPTIVLITIAANIGDTGLLQTEGCFTDSVVGLIPKKDVGPVFLELIMRGQKENLNKVATTGAQKNINNEILREVSVLLPSSAEQQRIADCLTRLDDLIAAQTQTLEALKTHKQGLMQQLFPSPEEVEA